MSSIVEIDCIHCHRNNCRKYGWLDPAGFTDPAAAIVTSVFFCAFCQKGNAVKIQYLPDNKMEFITTIELKTVIKDEPIPFFIGHPEEVEEVLSESDGLSLLKDLDDD